MDEADRVADRVAIIDHGQLLVLDTPERLKRQVGEGDTVEIRLEEARVDGQALTESFAGLNVQAGLEDEGHTVKIRALNAVGRLPELLGQAGVAGCSGWRSEHPAEFAGGCVHPIDRQEAAGMKALRVAWKYLLEFWREPQMLGLALGLPVFFVFITAVGYGTAPRLATYPLAVVVEAGLESDLTTRLAEARYPDGRAVFSVKRLDSAEAMDASLKAQNAVLGVQVRKAAAESRRWLCAAMARRWPLRGPACSWSASWRKTPGRW